MPSDAERILAEGVPITLADGQERHLRFGTRALMRLEKHFGGPPGINRALRFNSGAERLVHTLEELAEVAKATLLDDASADPTVTNTVIFLRVALPELTEEKIDELIDVREFRTYQRAIVDAFDQAFAPPEDEEGKAPGDLSRSSPGDGGTTSPPSSSDAEPLSSGP